LDGLPNGLDSKRIYEISQQGAAPDFGLARGRVDVEAKGY
jgi:hypothetical protein